MASEFDDSAGKSPPKLTIDDVAEDAGESGDDPSSQTAESEEREYDLRARESHVRSLEDDREARKKYTSRCFGLVCVWLGVVLAIVFLQGWNLGGFQLSDSVVITLISTTTASVIAIFVIVAKYLYPIK